MILCSFRDGVLLKSNLKKLAGLQYSSMDCLSLVLTHVRIRWTIPLNKLFRTLSAFDYYILRGDATKVGTFLLEVRLAQLDHVQI
jgi:hypothetical protein